jgi:hypothetical protein
MISKCVIFSVMKTAIIAIKNSDEEKFFRLFLKKTGISARILKRQEAEDAAFAALIDKGMKTKTVTAESVMKVLRKK